MKNFIYLGLFMFLFSTFAFAEEAENKINSDILVTGDTIVEGLPENVRAKYMDVLGSWLFWTVDKNGLAKSLSFSENSNDYIKTRSRCRPGSGRWCWSLSGGRCARTAKGLYRYRECRCRTDPWSRSIIEKQRCPNGPWEPAFSSDDSSSTNNEATLTCYTECIIGLEPLCTDAYNQCINSGTPPATCGLEYIQCQNSNESYCEWYCSNRQDRDAIMNKLKIIPEESIPSK